MGMAELLLAVAAAALAAVARRALDDGGPAERAGLAGAGAVLVGAALGLCGAGPVAAMLAGLGLAGFLPAIAAIRRAAPLRPEIWLTASAGHGLLALAAMAAELPLFFLLGPVGAQAASLTIGLVALDESPAGGGAAS